MIHWEAAASSLCLPSRHLSGHGGCTFQPRVHHYHFLSSALSWSNWRCYNWPQTWILLDSKTEDTQESRPCPPYQFLLWICWPWWESFPHQTPVATSPCFLSILSKDSASLLDSSFTIENSFFCDSVMLSDLIVKAIYYKSFPSLAFKWKSLHTKSWFVFLWHLKCYEWI